MGRNRILLIIVFAGLLLQACRGTDNQKSGCPDLENTLAVPTLTSHVEALDQLLRETSGLIHYNGKLWTINDSGGDPVLVAIDYETGRILQGIRIENAENEDWESLAQDDEFIYICDTGNNHGNRETLKIYKVAKSSVPNSGSALISSEIIEYRYAGRSSKTNLLHKSAYDCEAAFVCGDQLFLFTKNWETRTSTLYTCSTHPGTYELEPRKTFQVNGLITGADIQKTSGTVILCGYNNSVPFIWLYQDFNPVNYSHGESRRFDFPAFTDLQTEGVAFVSPERVIISSEKTRYPAALHRFEMPAW